LPVSSHPVLEGLGLIHGGCAADPAHSVHSTHHGHDAHQDHDHDREAGHDAGDHDLADGVCRKEAQVVKVPGAPKWTSLPAHLVAAMVCHFEALSVAVERRGDPPPSPVPPDLLPAWRFSLRAALPVRAPSSVS
jgi:hypothetical protein